MLIEAAWTGDRNLKALCGGEAVTPALAEGLASRSRYAWNVYGPTETTIWSSFDRIAAGQLITIGRLIANTQFYIVDNQGGPVPICVPGELWIGGDGVARGYLRRRELTTEKFVTSRLTSAGARVYKTGDLVRRLADGRIEWLGRLHQQIKVRGFRIELGEIESVLSAHPSVPEAVVLAREDVAGDKRLVAYLTVTEEETLREAELREELGEKLPQHMIPSAFVVLERFPLTPNGKLDRRALPTPGQHAFGVRSYQAPEGSTETVIAGIRAKALHLERVGRHDDFFDLGGHSLMALRAISQINTALKARLSVPEFFLGQTPERLAKAVEQKNRVGQVAHVVRVQEGHTGLPLYLIGSRSEEYRLAKLLGERSLDLCRRCAYSRRMASRNCSQRPVGDADNRTTGRDVQRCAARARGVVALRDLGLFARR
jgi:hypothetical protein